MNLPSVHSFKGREVRTLSLDGEQWWVAADVCTTLELSNPRSSMAALDADEKGVHTLDTLGGKQGLAIINESALYSLILRSRKPQAKEFKRWITHEVLPTIRKDGAYVSPGATRQQLKKLSKRVAELERLDAVFGCRTRFAEPSRRTGLPKVVPVRGHLRSPKGRYVLMNTDILQLLLGL